MKRTSIRIIILFILLPVSILSSCFLFQKKHVSGYTDTLYVYLSSPSPGYLIKHYKQRGSWVKSGERLYDLEAQPELYQQKAAQSFVKQMKQTLKDLERPRRAPEIAAIENQILQTQMALERVSAHYQRLLSLSQKQFVDEDTLYTNKKMVKELEFQKKQLEENLKLAHLGAREGQIQAQKSALSAAKAKLGEIQWYIEHKSVTAVSDGYIFDIFYFEGELVPALKPVMAMVVPKNNYIEFFVSSADLAQLKLNQDIAFYFYGDRNKHWATINYISQTIEYMPPVLFTQEYQEELVYRIRAAPKDALNFPLGQPIDVLL